MMHKGAREPSYKKRPGYHAAFLGGMALITTAFLAVGDLTTRDTIELRLAEDLKGLLSEVIPSSMYDNDLLDDTVELTVDNLSLFPSNEITVYRAQKSSEYVAAAFEVIGKGYAGDIHVLMGIDKQGKMLGVRVVSHVETPGLGDKIEKEKSNWIDSFSGLTIENPGVAQWAVKKDGGQFDQFSGATITPRAVVKAVKSGLEFYNQNKSQIYAVNTATSATEESTSVR